MTGHHAHGETVAVERQDAYDSDGIPMASTPHTITGCARDQTSTIEAVDGQQVVITRERLLCDDVNADVQPMDTLTLADGSTWRVSGDVDRPRNPFDGWSPGCVIPIERASGSIPPQIIEE